MADRTVKKPRDVTDRSTFVCNYARPGREVAFTLRFSRFRILCSITMITWRRGSTVSVEACFSSLGLAEGILHGQQTRTGIRTRTVSKLKRVAGEEWGVGGHGSTEHARLGFDVMAWRAPHFSKQMRVPMCGDKYTKILFQFQSSMHNLQRIKKYYYFFFILIKRYSISRSKF